MGLLLTIIVGVRSIGEEVVFPQECGRRLQRASEEGEVAIDTVRFPEKRFEIESKICKERI
jgi:hypothetical protein